MRSFLLIAMLLIAAGSSGKENKDLMKAKYYYSHLAYSDAIPYFEKIADTLNDPIIYGLLGDCYRYTGNSGRAAIWYNKAVQLPGYDTATALKFGQVLMQLQRYDEAAKWLTEYSHARPAERRVANLIAGCEAAAQTMKQIPTGAVSLAEVNTDAAEFAPTLWRGQLVFTSDAVVDVKKKTDKWSGNAYYNLYMVPGDSKGHTGEELKPVVQEKAVNIKYHTGPATFSGDGRQMYYTRSRYNDKFFGKANTNTDSTVLLEIMVASGYDAKEGKFEKVTPFEYNSDRYTVAHPAISPGGGLLAFTATMPDGAGSSDLYICRKAGDVWAAPENAGAAINTEGDEVFPYWADDSTLFFSSDGHAGLGGLDIYKAQLNTQLNTFSVPVNMGNPINSSYDDVSLAMYADGRSTYLSSNRLAAKKGDNIYFYKREKIYVQINVKDSATNEPVSNVRFSLTSLAERHDTVAASGGSYFKQLHPEVAYEVYVKKEGYRALYFTVRATSTKEIDTIFKNVILCKHKDSTSMVVLPPVTLPVSFNQVVGIPQMNKVYEIGHFYFSFNTADLDTGARMVLDSLVDYLVQKPTMEIEIRAHTDCRGGDAYNLNLSKERSLAVVNYLASKGIARRRLKYIGLGMRQPKIKCATCEQCTEEQHYLNRVLEFRILKL
ncbi:MAG: OmpA family protein [Bacteroidota bacterium]